MENYVVYVNNVGFVESIGHNGITYTNEIKNGFQTRLKVAKSIVDVLVKESLDCYILHIYG